MVNETKCYKVTSRSIIKSYWEMCDHINWINSQIESSLKSEEDAQKANIAINRKRSDLYVKLFGSAMKRSKVEEIKPISSTTECNEKTTYHQIDALLIKSDRHPKCKYEKLTASIV